MPVTTTIDTRFPYVPPSEEHLAEIRAAVGQERLNAVYEILLAHRVKRLAADAARVTQEQAA